MEAIPETRLAPELLCAIRTRGSRISATIAVDVVLPFVAEMIADPCSQSGREPVDRSGVELPEQLSGQGRPAAAAGDPRQRPRAAEDGRFERQRNRGAHRGRTVAAAAPEPILEAFADELAPTCVFSNSLYHSWWWRGSRIARSTRIDPQDARGVPGGDPAPLHRRADPRGAAGLGGAARPIADDEGVRGGSGGGDASADRDRALRHLERCQARRRADAAAFRNARGARGPATAGSARSSAAHRRRTTSARDVGRCRRPRSTGIRSGRSRRRYVKPGSTSRWGRSGSSGPIDQGSRLARQLGRLPKFGDWQAARRADSSLLTEWQVYRLFEARRGAWATFQYLVRERLLEEGARVSADGAVR